MAVELLCAADFHLGRRTRRLPEGIDAAACSPAAAFSRLVDTALARRPDAVLLAGDVVDQDNAFFEAFGPLEAGVRRLIEAQLPVLAVAGNHDHQVLARLADRIPEFVLLGRGGQWEAHPLERDGRVLARICGWSFPRRHVRENPMADWPRPEPGPLVVGLLHCDLGAGESLYAPVSCAELEGAGAAAWVLGHVHAPRVLRGSDPLVLYCGSPQGLDPTETGPHGAWWIGLDGEGRTELEQIPLCGLRWEDLEIGLDGIDHREDFDKAVIDGIRGLQPAMREAGGDLRAVGCRLTLGGRTAIHDRIGAWIEELTELRLPGEVSEFFVDKVRDEAAPALDLEQLARVADPPGLLARRIRALQSGSGEEYQRLLHGARAGLEAMAGSSGYVGLGDPPLLDDGTVAELLRRAGIRLLEILLAQRGEGG